MDGLASGAERLVKKIPRLSALVPETNCFADHTQYLRGKYSLLVQVLQLENQITGKNKFDAVIPAE